MGVPGGDANLFLFASYLQFMEQQGPNSRPLAQKTFKSKLVDLLRDTLGLALPAGTNLRSGDYFQRKTGSVVPCLRLRKFSKDDDEAPGVIRHAVMATVMGTDQQAAVTGGERDGNAKTPVGNACNASNAIQEVGHKEENQHPPEGAVDAHRDAVDPHCGEESSEPVTPVTCVTYRGSQRSRPVTEAGFPVTHHPLVEVLDLKTGEWQTGWQRIGEGKGSASVLCLSPGGQSRLIGKTQIRLPQQLRAA
jgi:hypothetical protein